MKQDLTEYDIKPKEFINYLRYYGPHFNKNLCEFVCSELYKYNYTKEKVEQLLKTYGITLKSNQIYDAVYIANQAKYLFYGSGISDEKHLALYVKDVFEKEEDLVFNRCIADMAKRGIVVEWEDMI